MIKPLMHIILFLISFNLFAQPAQIKSIFDKYAGKEGYTTVNLNDPSMIFDYFNVPELREATKGISTMKTLSCEQKKKGSDICKALANDLKNLVLPSEYKEFMSVSEEDVEVKMYVKKTGNNNASEFMLTSYSKSFTDASIVWISGNIDLRMIKDIIKKLK